MQFEDEMEMVEKAKPGVVAPVEYDEEAAQEKKGEDSDSSSSD